MPLSDGTKAAINIKQLTVGKSTKTLNIWTNPAGDCQKQLDIFYDVIKKWTDRLLGGKLPARWAWVRYVHQLWAKLQCGLGANSSIVETLEGGRG